MELSFRTGTLEYWFSSLKNPGVLLLGWFVCVFAQAESVSWGHEGDWRSLSSQHFVIHYLPELESSAIRSLEIAEQVHQDLVPFFGVEPDRPTGLVITDDVDLSNGWATPMPYPQIRLYASPPESQTSLARYDDWLHLLIRHEYVHILHLEMARGVAKGSRSIFGRWPLSFPHMFSPSMIIEGLAVYFETNESLGYGRLGSSFYDMQMAVEVASGMDDYQEVLVANRNWPYGKAYLYGAYFVDYLVREYGKKGIKRYLSSYAVEVVPYLNWRSTFYHAFGRSLDQLWEGFRADMAQRFAGWELADGRGLVHVDSQTQSRQQLATNGKALLAYRSNGEDRNAVWRYQVSKTLSDSPSSLYIKRDNLVSMSLGKDGALAYIRLIPEASGNIFGDVFITAADGNTDRLTEHFRARHLVWLPDQSGLLVTRIVAGISELHLMDLYGDSRLIWQGQSGDVLAGLAVNPSGEQVVASVKRAGRGWNLELMDRESGQWKTLTNTMNVETDPSWEDNQHILFSADYSGKFQIYRMNIHGLEQHDKPEQLTQVSSGAFTPIRLSDERLVFQQYGADGYQLKQLEVAREAQSSRDQRVSNSEIIESESIESMGIRSDSIESDRIYPEVGLSLNISADQYTSYRPWSSLAPTGWLPLYAFTEHQNELGLYTWGSDALGRHSYGLTASFNGKYQLLNTSFSYLYDTRWQLVAQRSHDYQEPASGQIYIVQQDALALMRTNIVNAFEDKLSFNLGSHYQRDRLVKSPLADSAGQGLVGAALVYDGRRYFTHSPGVGYGHYSYLVAETNDLLESDYEGDVIQLSLQQNIDLPGRDGLSITLQGGWADPEGKRFQLGGMHSNTVWFGRTRIGLPGYSSGADYGNQYHYERLEWRHWLHRFERNWNAWPIGLGDISMTSRAEGAQAWEEGERRDWLPSLSVELNVELVVGFRVLLPATIGVASGLGEDGINSLYAGFSVPL